jgi:hypothetical protein
MEPGDAGLRSFPKQSVQNGKRGKMAQVQQLKTPIEARQGETGGHMRWVVLSSTGMAVIAMGAIYLWFMH